jgi:hypothetical protein
MTPHQLHSAQEFDKALFKLVRQYNITQTEAFNELNTQYQKATGHPRYASFKSYCNQRAKRLKAKK